MRYLIVLLVCIIIPVQGFTQHILVLEKEGAFERQRFYIGDEITFLAGPQDVKFSGAILAINDSSFTIGTNHFKPAEVSTFIFPKRKNGAKALRKAAFGGALTMFVIAGLDRGINQKAKPLYDPPTINLVASFLGLGLLTYLVPEKKYVLPKQRVLRIINVTPG